MKENVIQAINKHMETMDEKELAYCENDVLAMVEAYVTEMRYNNDNLYTIPLLQRDT